MGNEKKNMRYQLAPIKEVEYLKFFELIDKNRSRLKKDFPNTIKEVQTRDDSKKHLKNSDIKRMDKKKFLFGIYEKENLIGYINIKILTWKFQNVKLDILLMWVMKEKE